MKAEAAPVHRPSEKSQLPAEATISTGDPRVPFSFCEPRAPVLSGGGSESRRPRHGPRPRSHAPIPQSLPGTGVPASGAARIHTESPEYTAGLATLPQLPADSGVSRLGEHSVRRWSSGDPRGPGAAPPPHALLLASHSFRSISRGSTTSSLNSQSVILDLAYSGSRYTFFSSAAGFFPLGFALDFLPREGSTGQRTANADVEATAGPPQTSGAAPAVQGDFTGISQRHHRRFCSHRELVLSLPSPGESGVQTLARGPTSRKQGEVMVPLVSSPQHAPRPLAWAPRTGPPSRHRARRHSP